MPSLVISTYQRVGSKCAANPQLHQLAADTRIDFAGGRCGRRRRLALERYWARWERSPRGKGPLQEGSSAMQRVDLLYLVRVARSKHALITAQANYMRPHTWRKYWCGTISGGSACAG